MNKDTFGDSVDEGQLRYEITMCLQGKGYQVPVGQNPGVPINRINDALECKKKAMEQFEISESFGTPGGGGGMSPPVNSGDSVFENNCPKKGSKILFLFTGDVGGQKIGHAVVCTVMSCIRAFGEAVLSCVESSFSRAPGASYQLKVGVDGSVTPNPQSTPPLTNGQNSAWTQIK